MSSKYILSSVSRFERDFKRISKKEKKVAKKIISCIEVLSENPFKNSLNTHKVSISGLGEVYSSRVTGDLRIIWFLTGKREIILYRVGGHSGGSNIYK